MRVRQPCHRTEQSCAAGDLVSALAPNLRISQAQNRALSRPDIGLTVKGMTDGMILTLLAPRSRTRSSNAAIGTTLIVLNLPPASDVTSSLAAARKSSLRGCRRSSFKLAGAPGPLTEAGAGEDARKSFPRAMYASTTSWVSSKCSALRITFSMPSTEALANSSSVTPRTAARSTSCCTGGTTGAAAPSTLWTSEKATDLESEKPSGAYADALGGMQTTGLGDGNKSGCSAGRGRSRPTNPTEWW